MALVKPGRFVDLKNRVKAECKRRAYQESMETYGKDEYWSLLSYEQPDTGKIVDKLHRDEPGVCLAIINEDTMLEIYGVTKDEVLPSLIRDSELTGMEAFITTLEKRSMTDHTGTDCKGSCRGACYGCQGTCYNACTSCTGTCSGECSTTCTGGCDGCSGCGGCGGCGGCSGSCSGTCDGGCSGGCSGNCSGNCFSCSGGCAGCTNCAGCSSCSGTCGGTCSGGCYYNG